MGLAEEAENISEVIRAMCQLIDLCLIQPASELRLLSALLLFTPPSPLSDITHRERERDHRGDEAVRLGWMDRCIDKDCKRYSTSAECPITSPSLCQFPLISVVSFPSHILCPCARHKKNHLLNLYFWIILTSNIVCWIMFQGSPYKYPLLGESVN